MRVMTFNIRHGRGLDGKVRIRRTIDLVRRFNPDILALNEVDSMVIRSYFCNQPKLFAQELKMNYLFHPLLRITPGHYGNALLYKGEILEQAKYRLPYMKEPRGCLKGVFRIPGGVFEVYLVHLGVIEKEREMQLFQLYNLLDKTNRPKIILGDFNQTNLNNWLKETNLSLPTQGNGSQVYFATYPQPNPKKQIDFIVLSDHWKVHACFSKKTNVSDHGPLIVDIEL